MLSWTYYLFAHSVKGCEARHFGKSQNITINHRKNMKLDR